MKHALVLATRNRGKVEELRHLLADLPLEIHALPDVLPNALPVVEDGRTFAENAIKKARAAASGAMMLALADDSGLEVDALDGRPGVYSARFAHERATDSENNAALLDELEALGDPVSAAQNPTYGARFRCALALIDPFGKDAEPIVVEGVCEGRITSIPRGSGGFGYDPLFVLAGVEKTMAELSEAEKNEVSHRARAFAALRPVLSELLFARERQIRKICD
ncbi:RdgB/HAM1 family non-canonical purine NTP pyrophosphatase [Pendulispora albinea]|uniref:dITP/XTP pyrophosphatase n=1 Tax=Pendulispora albinea TaxID=2741071 RepID=A0ABZ2LXK8_9BACT